jgi:phage baseplate assembly protein W
MNNIIGYTTVGTDSTTTQLIGLDLAIRDLTNHFHIRKGEKWTNPEFGSNIPYLVFQPLDDITVSEIRDDVIDIVSYDPRFTLNDTTITVKEDNNYVFVSANLTYIPTTTATELQLKFDKEFEETIEY